MKTTDFSKEEIEKAIRAVELKAKVNRELSLEAVSEDLRALHAKAYLEYQTRLNELQTLLDEVLSGTSK